MCVCARACVLGILPKTLTCNLKHDRKHEVGFHSANQYTGCTFCPTHICGNDHSWWVAAAGSAWAQDLNWLI